MSAAAAPNSTGATHTIFVTGGVMSSLGKGLTASALAAVLQARGFTVTQQKLDPYLNVDPGTMSPFQHGEVYVTDDGAETDLDLGHYERFTGVPTSKHSNITAGQIYWNILHRERKGDYLGKTVQMVPHVTNEIMDFIAQTEGKANFALIEVGGTVGDIEGAIFIEAIRQYAVKKNLQHKQNGNPNPACCFLHLTYAPYLRAVGEIKTKPSQNAVRELLQMGIQADVVVVRSEMEVPQPDLDKIALFANLPSTHVVNCPDSDTIYRVPTTLHMHGLDDAVLQHFGLTNTPAPNLMNWQRVSAIASFDATHANSQAITQPIATIKIAVVGKYVQLGDAYKSLNEALLHGGFAHNAKVEIDFVDSEALEKCTDAELQNRLQNAAGILIPGGFGARGTEGKIRAIQYAREHKVPFFGICLGLQMAIIEAARNLAGLQGAGSTEFNIEHGIPQHALICQMTEWQTTTGEKMHRAENGNLGGTMRLGAYPAQLQAGSLAESIYQSATTFHLQPTSLLQTANSSKAKTKTTVATSSPLIITERHRHRFEFNPRYRAQLEKTGLVFSGTSPTDPHLAEIIELPKAKHPFFLAVQYHPEFKSQPLHPHPLFSAFIAAALQKNH